MCLSFIKGTVIQIEKALANVCLRISKVSWKFCILTIYNFAVIYLLNFLFSSKEAYFLIVSIAFYVYKQRLSNSKTKAAINAKISIFIFCVEAIKYLLLHNLHDCTFKEAVQTVFFLRYKIL